MSRLIIPQAPEIHDCSFKQSAYFSKQDVSCPSGFPIGPRPQAMPRGEVGWDALEISRNTAVPPSAPVEWSSNVIIGPPPWRGTEGHHEVEDAWKPRVGDWLCPNLSLCVDRILLTSPGRARHRIGGGDFAWIFLFTGGGVGFGRFSELYLEGFLLVEFRGYNLSSTVIFCSQTTLH